MVERVWPPEAPTHNLRDLKDLLPTPQGTFTGFTKSSHVQTEAVLEAPKDWQDPRRGVLTTLWVIGVQSVFFEGMFRDLIVSWDVSVMDYCESSRCLGFATHLLE